MLSQLAVLSLAVVAIASPVASIKGRNLVGNGFESFNPFNAELSQNLAGSTLAKYKQTSRTPRLPMLQGLADVVSEGPVRILKGSLRTDRIKPRQASGRSSDIPLDNFSGDTLYVGDFSAGTPAQQLRTDFDTGSADLWINNVACGRCLGTTPGAYDGSVSSTGLRSTQPFQITYGTGAVRGTLAQDQITVGGFSVQQIFGSVDQVSDDFIDFPANGIFGLGFQRISSSGARPFVQTLIAQGMLARNLFGFFFTRQQDRAQVTGSTLDLGGIDETHVNESQIIYHPVVSESYWEIAAGRPIVDGQQVGEPYLAAIDTGTTLIYLPSAITRAFYAAIPGAAPAGMVSGGDFYTYPCAYAEPLALTFMDNNNVERSYNIDPEDFNLGTFQGQCVGAVMGLDFTDTTGQPLAIIGNAFLKEWYSVFNFEGSNTGTPAVGFGRAK